MERSNKDMSTKRGPATRKVTRPGVKWLYRLGGLLILVIGGGALFSAQLDSMAIESVRCVVVSAEPKTASGGLRGSVSTPAVLVQTSNCGPIEVSKGVTFDRRQEVASSFKVGAEYDFEIGWFSRVVMKDFLHQIQSAQDYRLAE